MNRKMKSNINWKYATLYIFIVSIIGPGYVIPKTFPDIGFVVYMVLSGLWGAFFGWLYPIFIQSNINSK